MNDDVNETVDCILKAADATEAPTYEERARSIAGLREKAETSQEARMALAEVFRTSSDTTVRVLAAEALSTVRAFSFAVIPVLGSVLEAAGKRGFVKADMPLVETALKALVNYRERACLVERHVWPALYSQADPGIRKLAVKVLANIALVSPASKAVCCVLCMQDTEEGREVARECYDAHLRRKRLESRDDD